MQGCFVVAYVRICSPGKLPPFHALDHWGFTHIERVCEVDVRVVVAADCTGMCTAACRRDLSMGASRSRLDAFRLVLRVRRAGTTRCVASLGLWCHPPLGLQCVAAAVFALLLGFVKHLQGASVDDLAGSSHATDHPSLNAWLPAWLATRLLLSRADDGTAASQVDC